MCGCLSHVPLLGTWPATQTCALTGNWTHNPLVCRPALNPLSYTSQGHFFFFLRLSFLGASQIFESVVSCFFFPNLGHLQTKYLFFEYFFRPTFFPLSFWHEYFIFYYNPRGLWGFAFFSLFSFCCFDWVISIFYHSVNLFFCIFHLTVVSII